MNIQKSQSETFIGIDVGKQFLDLFILPQEIHQQVPNTPDTVQSLVKLFLYLEPQRIVVEASGRYENELVFACDSAKLPIV